MAVDPVIAAALETAQRVARGTARLPFATDRASGFIPTDEPVTSGSEIPPYVQALAATLLQLAEANVDAGFLTVQQGSNAAIADINQLRFSGGPTVAGLGNNVASVEFFGPLAAGQLLAPARAGTTADIATAMFTVDAGGPFLDQLETAAVPAIDGIAVWTLGDRVLVKDQTVGSQNGVYEVIQTGPPFILQRVADYIGNQDPGRVIQTLEGTANAGDVWEQSAPTTDPVVVGGAAADTLVFSQAPGFDNASALLEETVGAVGTGGTYATLDAAATAFAAGTWGDGVHFNIWFVDATPQTTDWTLLPATCRVVNLRTCVEPGLTITAMAQFDGSVRLSGPMTVDVDASALAGNTNATRDTFVEVTNGALVTSTLNAGMYDIIQAPAGTGTQYVTITNGARVEEFQFTNANGPAPQNATLHVSSADLVAGIATARSGHQGPTVMQDATYHGSLSTGTDGVVVGCTITATNISPTDRIAFGGVVAQNSVTITRELGGTVFALSLTGLVLDSTFTIVDGAGAVPGSVEVRSLSGATVLHNVTMPNTTGTAIVDYSVAAFDLAAMSETVFPNVSLPLSSSCDAIIDCTFQDAAADVDLLSPSIRGLTLICTGPGNAYNVGVEDAFGSLTQNVVIDLSGAAVGPMTQVRGYTIRNVRITEPEAGLTDPADLVVGNAAAFGSGQETNLVSGLTYDSTRGTGADGAEATVRAKHVEDVTWRQDTGGDATAGLYLTYVHARRINVAGALILSPVPEEYDPAEIEQLSTATDVFATGTSRIVGDSTPGPLQAQVLTNCFFAGAFEFQSTPTADVDLSLTNVRVAGAATQANTYRDVTVAGSIASTPLSFTASGTKAIGASVIGFS